LTIIADRQHYACVNALFLITGFAGCHGEDWHWFCKQHQLEHHSEEE